MTRQEILKQVQSMYRRKSFELDDSGENIVVVELEFIEKGGHYHSDETYHETIRMIEHFCTIEFARRLLKANNPMIGR